MKAEDLLPIIEEAMVKRMEMQASVEGSRWRLGRAEDLIWREHYVLAHWFVQPVWEMLRSENRNAVWLPPVILEFCKVFGNPVWLSRMLTGDLSTPAAEVDVGALCQQSLERVSRELGRGFSLTIAVEMAKVATDEYVLRQALEAFPHGSGPGREVLCNSLERTFLLYSTKECERIENIDQWPDIWQPWQPWPRVFAC